MKIQVLWYVMSCHLIKYSSCFKGACSLQLQGPAVQEDCQLTYSLQSSQNFQRVNKNTKKLI